MGLEQLRSAELKEKEDSERNETGIKNGGISKVGQPLVTNLNFRRECMNLEFGGQNMIIRLVFVWCVC